MELGHLAKGLLDSVVFSMLGLMVFFAGFFALRRVMPFDVHKEIEQDQNTALGIVIGSFILGLAFIIGMALHG